MILADTSIWIDHFRRADDSLTALIGRKSLLVHPFIVGELAVGSLHNRAATLHALGKLPTLLPARNSEVLRLIETSSLHGLGLGWMDVHLLCAVILRPGSTLWTRDRKLESAARRLGVASD